MTKLIGGALLGSVAARTGVARTSGSQAENLSGPDCAPQRAPVVSFFLDQPYLDATASDVPYRPPQGLRGGEPIAGLSEGEFRSIAPHG